MSTGTIASEMIHFFVAALWTGSTMFFALVVLPVSRASLTDRILDRFMILTRASALVMVLTGGHLAVTIPDSTYETGRGHAIVGMMVLWLVLIGLLEVANARADGDSVGTTSTRLFQASALVAAGLLVDAGLLLSNAG